MNETGRAILVNCLDYVTVRRAEEILRDLVSRPSINPSFPGGQGESAVAEYVRAFFEQLGIPHRIDPVDGERCNVVGMYEGRENHRAIILEAHVDTVQVIGMTIDPFAGEVRDGRLYGRGACDTKASLTSMLLAFEAMKRANVAPPVSVHLAAVVDEEVTYKGIAHIANEVERGCLHYEAGIVGEPTQMQIVIAHKGCVRFHVDVEGKACHSSQPQHGVNAIDMMLEVLTHLRDVTAPQYVHRIHPLVGSATHCVSVIEGGVATNTVPAACRITIDRRTIPGEEPMDVWRSLKEEIESLSTSISQLKVTVNEPFIVDYAMEVNRESQIVHHLAASVETVTGHANIVGVPYGTDASKLTRVGVPTVVFGPGSIEQAHTHDEWIDLEEVVKCAEVLLHTILNYQ